MDNYINQLINDNKRHTGGLVLSAVMHTATFIILSAVFLNAYKIGYFAGDEFAWEHQNLAIAIMLYTLVTVVSQGMWASITLDEAHKRKENLDSLAFYANKGIEARREEV